MTPPSRRTLTALSRALAIPPAIYTTSLAAGAWIGLSGSAPPLLPLLFVASASVGLYVLDRAKLTGSRLDPADDIADPARQAWIRRAPSLFRGLGLTAMVTALSLGMQISPWAVLGLVGAAIGVVLYSGGRPGSGSILGRAKDRPWIKNVGVALGAMLVISPFLIEGEAPIGRLAFMLGSLALIVYADAMLCDLDDLGADRRCSVSPPLGDRLGIRAVVLLGGALLALGSVGVVVAGGVDLAGIRWGVAMLLLSLPAIWMDRSKVWLDLRPAGALVLMVALGPG